jgi:hypothetical protein
MVEPGPGPRAKEEAHEGRRLAFVATWGCLFTILGAIVLSLLAFLLLMLIEG